MSIPDSNSSASVTVSPSLVTASETPVRLENTVRTPPSQPPPAPPPPPPPPYRPIAPLHHPNPLQQPHNNLHPQPIPIRHSNQDPSAVLSPSAPPGLGSSARPVRMSSPLVADPSATSGNQSGYPPRPVPAYNHRQFGPTQIESMMQFMRARNPQIHPFPLLGSGSPVGSGPIRASPNFRQPRVAPPSTPVLDTNRIKKSRRRDEALVLVKGRKVRITEGTSLYSLCRSWLRNGAHEGIQERYNETFAKAVTCGYLATRVPDDDPAEEPTDDDKEDEESVKQLSEKDLLKRHIERAKNVRARLREERLRKIKRYKARLALILPQSEE